MLKFWIIASFVIIVNESIADFYYDRLHHNQRDFLNLVRETSEKEPDSL